MIKLLANLMSGVKEIVPFLVLISTMTNVANFGLQIDKLNHFPQQEPESSALLVESGDLIETRCSPLR